MVDVNKLRKKFPGKDPQKSRNHAKIRAIAREYEMKKAELGARAPIISRGFPYYMVIIIGMILLAALVIPQILSSGPTLDVAGKKVQTARTTVHNLAVALGRYRYHVGFYPSNEDGLLALAYRIENGYAAIAYKERSSKYIPVTGWNGPYIKRLNDDPWKHPYVYVNNGEDEVPTLYSHGPDGKAGTTDDIIADPADFDEPFKDTSWTKGWVPQYLRGYVVAQTESQKEQLQREVDDILHPKTNAADVAKLVDRRTLVFETLSLTEETAKIRATYSTNGGTPMTNEFTVHQPIPWKPSRPFLYRIDLEGERFSYPVRTMECGPDGKCVLNGEPLELKAVAMPGAAFSGCDSKDKDYLVADTRRILYTLKDTGANAVLVPSCDPDVLEAFDEIGFIVLGEDARDVAVAGRVDELVDRAGRLTDSAWALRAKWSEDYETFRLTPEWSGTEGEEKKVRFISSGDEAELFVNDESHGRLKGTNVEWTVKYAPGGIKAIAYRDGAYIGEAEAKTPGDPFAVKAVSDTERLSRGEYAFVRVLIEDENGIEVGSAANEISFAIDGPGEIVEVRREGSCRLAVVRGKGGSGRAVELRASAKGLVSATVKFVSR